MVDVSIVDGNGNGNVINSVQAKSGDDGKFMARLPAMSACKNPLMMKVACAGESVQCRDVLVGDVWLWVVNQIWSGKFKKVLERRYARSDTACDGAMFQSCTGCLHIQRQICTRDRLFQLRKVRKDSR